MTEFDVSPLLPIIEKAARDVHYTHGIEEDEAFSVLSLEAVEHARNYLILFREGQTGLIETRLKNVARVYARKERVQRMSDADQYFYDPEYVRLFLPFFFDYEDWTNGPTPEDVSAKWVTGEAIDTALDIKAAWPRLRDWQATVIQERHLGAPNEDGGPDWDRIAGAMGRKSADSARNAYGQATRELTVEMNVSRAARIDNHEGPGARHAISNAAAGLAIKGDM
ncbi:hypothetical protein O7635_29425 [Asanoa sp. WMMD1127]|uniref:hypothetical protein n=1 Tax=Asanoa sp. WMMD1127 TaxID=3016107 RepID=UPI002416F444|nr:hypothetical protein [Asanoa sp. WMMD1127]MDG4825990.1 hypothetical protein [Asanoa sp. WMMD1127]